MPDGLRDRTLPHPDARPVNAMCIGFLVYRYPVVSETFVLRQVAGLRARGCDLTVFALHPSLPTDEPARAFETEHGLGPACTRPDFAESAWRTGLRVAAKAPVRSWRLAPLAMLGPSRIARIVREAGMFAAARDVDVLHCQFATIGLDALRHIKLGTLRPRRLVVHLRGSDVTKFVREKGESVYDELFARADLFIANCEHFRQKAIALGCPAEKVIVIGSPIDMARFELRPPRVPDASPARLVAVGRLVEKKGFADGIEAVAILRDRGCNVSLDIVGDGPLRSTLQAQVDHLDLRDRVRFAGAQSQAGVISSLREADIALAPSVRAASGDEDAPVNTLKEAMAMGLPVVATRHGGIPELVRDGESGYLVAERAPGALADAIARLVAMPERWANIGKAGRARVAAQYDQEIIMDRTLGAYQRILGSQGDPQ